MSFRITSQLWDKICHFASFPQTPVSLQQMVLFGQNPSQGMLLKGAEFLGEELPVRLAHRVKELSDLPQGMSEMPSIIRVKEWYAQSFEEIVNFPPPKVPPEFAKILHSASLQLPDSVPNPSLEKFLPIDTTDNSSMFLSPASSIAGLKSMSPKEQKPISLGNGTETTNGDGNGNKASGKKMRIPMARRYYYNAEQNMDVVWPPEVYEYNKRFTKVLETIKKRHDPTVTTVAGGVLEWKRKNRSRLIGSDVQRFLDRFYMSRIGIRFLIGQHIALNNLQPHPDYVGIICTRSRLHDIASEAIENARFVCEEHYGMFKAPPVQLICPRDLTFAYVPGHLSHIIFELLKNSLRAVVERYGNEPSPSPAAGSSFAPAPGGMFPPIKVIVVEGNEDITIKISDEGGGIPRSAIPLVWTYMYTTMDVEAQGVRGSRGSLGSSVKGSMSSLGSMGNVALDRLQNARNDFAAPMAGFGYGLPLSRLYARYFGGDLKLISMEGYGTDVYIHLNRLSSSREPLQ